MDKGREIMQLRHPPCLLVRSGITILLLCLLFPGSLQAQSNTQVSPEVRALLDKGIAEAKLGHREEAVRLYGLASQTARMRHDPPGEAAALTVLGRAVLYQAPPKAMAYLAEA